MSVDLRLLRLSVGRVSEGDLEFCHTTVCSVADKKHVETALTATGG